MNIIEQCLALTKVEDKQHAGRMRMQAESIEAGASEYYIDENNQRAFRWVTCEETEMEEEI